MKKLFVTMLLVMAFATISFAQVGNGYDNAIGVRVGLHNTYEVSYQRYIFPSGRIEGTVGVQKYNTKNDFNVHATYQWMVQIPTGGQGTLQWYPGVGAQVGNWNEGHWNGLNSKKGFSCGAVAQVGIEYTFGRLPLMVSADYRPVFYFMQESKVTWYNVALAVRFCF